MPNIPINAVLLGKGLWSNVYDLENGTVLKISRENSVGIGNGKKKNTKRV